MNWTTCNRANDRPGACLTTMSGRTSPSAPQTPASPALSCIMDHARILEIRDGAAAEAYPYHREES